MSYKMTTARLIQAIETIKCFTGNDVVKIEFEDGSGNNFNYRCFGDKQDKFINYSTMVDGLGFDPANLCTSELTHGK